MGQSKYGQESGLPPHQKWPATAKTSAAVTGLGVGVAAGLGGTTGLGVTVELGESAVVPVPMPAQPANTHRTRTAINAVGFRAGMGLLEFFRRSWGGACRPLSLPSCTSYSL
jgi:hypothetical protein